MMKAFGKVYEKSLPPDVLKIYFEVYEEVPNGKTKFIIKECLKKCKYFPKTADIFECIREEEFVPDSYVNFREVLKKKSDRTNDKVI